MKGIYKYTDLKTGEVVYVGKDSHINKNLRHRQHLQPSNYDAQQFNRILQNNPKRYEYSVLYSSDDVSEDDLNMLEMSFIERYNPKFNFTKGGDGVSYWDGKNRSEETKRKISEGHKGKKLTKEHKQKISKNNGRYWKGKTRSEETKRKISEAKKGEKHNNWKNYARIVKDGFQKNKQRYGLKFNGEILKHSINPDKLVEWFLENYPLEIIKIPTMEE